MRIPVVQPVVFKGIAIRGVGNLRQRFLQAVFGRRIRNVVRVDPVGRALASTLMRELVWLVEVEGIDHIAVRERLLREQIGDA